MTNQKLREEWLDFVEKGIWQGEDDYTRNFRVEDVATWWLSKIAERNKELVKIIKDLEYPRDMYVAKYRDSVLEIIIKQRE